MRALVQRVTRASVRVDRDVGSEIGPGLLVLLGVGRDDSDNDAGYIADKVANLRIFADSQGKMNLSVLDVSGSVLVVSQFTLYADTTKGRRPSFVDAAHPDLAAALVDAVVQRLVAAGATVATGVFGAHMEVELVNDGPVTILVESPRSG